MQAAIAASGSPRWVTSKTPQKFESPSDNAPPPAIVGSKISGYLQKQGEKGLVKTWKRRWFVFDKEDGKLHYYQGENEKLLGVIDLYQSSVQHSAANRREFAVHYLATGRVYLLLAASEADAGFWVTHLDEWKANTSLGMSPPRGGMSPPSGWHGTATSPTVQQLKPTKKTNSLLLSRRTTKIPTQEDRDKDIKELVKKIASEQQDITSVRKALQTLSRPYSNTDIHAICLQLATHMEYLQTCLTEVSTMQEMSDDSFSEQQTEDSGVDTDSEYTEEPITTSFLLLPAGLVYYVFSFLKPEDLARSGQVSHTWQTYADNPSLWAQFISIPASKYDPLRNWKSVYVSSRVTIAKKDVRVVSMYGLPPVAGTAKEGWLTKRGEDLLKIWKRRWFVIKDNCLYYFKTPKDQLPFGVIPLTSLTITMVKGTGKKYCFLLRSMYSEMNALRQVSGHVTESQRVECLLSGESEEECLSWITELRNNMTVDRSKDKSKLLKHSLSFSGPLPSMPQSAAPQNSPPLERKYQIFGVPLSDVMAQQQQRGENGKIPTFLEKAIKCLSEKAINEEGLFRVSGGLGEINKLKESLEQGIEVDYPSHDPHALSGLVKYFFRELPERIVPTDLNNYAATVASGDNQQRELSEKLTEFKFILQQLPLHNYNLLKSLLQFLVEVAAHADANKMTENNLLRVFTPTIHCAPQLIGYSMHHFSYLFSEDRV